MILVTAVLRNSQVFTGEKYMWNSTQCLFTVLLSFLKEQKERKKFRKEKKNI